VNKLHPGESLSIWMDTADVPTFPRLAENVTVDVCVVGGGLGGLTTAYLLSREGKKVCVLEDFEIASGQTGRTTAHFVTSVDNLYYEIEKYHGEQGAFLTAHSYRAALDLVEDIIKRENISCEFEKLDGYLFTEPNSSEEKIYKEIETVHRAGLLNVQLLLHVPWDAYETGACLKFPNQLQLHPIKYINGLAQCILKNGGQIYTKSHVLEVQGGDNAFVKTKEVTP